MSMICKTLGTFECTALLDKGGMGEVYKAKDKKLGRDVAIKVLPEEFAKDTDRVARFRREAKLLASLNHPNIAAIYGLEESDGTHFLVLELIEGETLADRIRKGAIPVEEALKLALQITEALEAAHEKGVIHRDLKPANIKITPEGKVKVLDFGLAKAFAGDQEEMILSDSPTLSVAATQKGMILGTAAYMSPEQARGKSVDKRTDVWAFGVVLFEMLTGCPVFEGDDVSQTLARVLERQPDYSTLAPNLHPRIRFLLERCLEKEAKNRNSSISDARVEIQKVLTDPSGVFVQPITAAKLRKQVKLGLSWFAVAIVLSLIVSGVTVWYLKPSEPRHVIRFDYELPEDRQLGGMYPLAVSPDGKQFVYSTPNGLYLRPVDDLTARLIAGTEGGIGWPFFSPDGKWIGYLSYNDRQLKKISVNGGTPIALCDAERLGGGWWDADDTIIYGQYPNDIMRIPASGGTPESLIKIEDRALICPQILPDGKSLLYTSLNPNFTQPRIMVKPFELEEPKELFAGWFIRYLPTGHIVYVSPDQENQDLMAVTFDLDGLEATGNPVLMVEDVGDVALSDSGTLVYLPTSASSADEAVPQRSLVWVDREGQEEPLDAPLDNYMFPKISPDGTKVALTIMGEQADIWIWDLFRKTRSRLTLDDARDVVPLWTPDGKRIVFVSGLTGRTVYWRAADGAGDVEQLGSFTGSLIFPSSWSGDGKILVLNERNEQSPALNFDISVMSMGGDHTRTPLLQEEFSEANPQVSPDGRYIAYTSNESEQVEIYIRPFPDVNSGKCQVSTSGGKEPRWSPDGKELFYRNPSGDAIMAVGIETEPTLKPGIPKELFRGAYFSYVGHNWDIHPDGERFLMIKPPETTEEESSEESTEEAPHKINIVLNWIEELKERVPGD